MNRASAAAYESHQMHIHENLFGSESPFFFDVVGRVSQTAQADALQE